MSAPAQAKELRTVCRMCESHCGVIASADEGPDPTSIASNPGVWPLPSTTPLRLRPDPDHPLSRGYACKKGLRFPETALRSSRISEPRVRTDGVLRATSVSDALQQAGTRLRAIRDRHGPNSVALFLGNATAYSGGATLGADLLRRTIGTRRVYSSLTLDNAPQLYVADRCLGSPLRTFIADYAGSDCVVLFGTDPLASQASQSQSHPHGVRDLLKNRAALIVVDPRRSTTAAQADQHLAPRPGSDVALLSCLLRAALDTPERASGVRFPAEDRAILRNAVARFSVEAAAAETGLSPERIHALITRLLAAKRPLVWSGLGVLLGPEGSVGWWLTLCLQTALGGLGEAWRYQAGPIGMAGLTGILGLYGSDPHNRSRIGGYGAVMGHHAAATLAEDVLSDDEDRTRALVVIGGNPAVSLPDSAQALAALARLELLVVIDPFETATSRMAHVTLPATTWIERPERILAAAELRSGPDTLDHPTLRHPPGQAKDDWDWARDLAAAAGLPFGGARLVSWWLQDQRPEDVSAWLLRLRRWWPVPKTLDAVMPTVKLAPAELVAALQSRLPRGDDGLRLVTSSREIGAMNTWIRGAPVRGGRVHPDDRPESGVLEVLTGSGPVLVPVEAEPSLGRGTLVIPWGDDESEGGLNSNRLTRATEREPFTGQPAMNGGKVMLAAR